MKGLQQSSDPFRFPEPEDVQGPLAETLRSFRRPGAIRSRGSVDIDPVAKDLLLTGQNTIDAVTQFLKEQGIIAFQIAEGGYGFSSLVLDASDRIVRLSFGSPTLKPAVIHVLKPLVSKRVGKIHVLIAKKLDMSNITEDDVRKVQTDLGAQGYRWNDAGMDNLGRDERGDLWIIDGSVVKASEI